MKLAEALALRADMQARLAQLAERATDHARYQEGEVPAEDAVALMAQYDALAMDLEELIVRINRTNLASSVAPGLTITAALARRDRLHQQHRMRTRLANAAAQSVDRYSRTEIRSVTAINVRAVREEADALAREARELDARIQETNWTIELPEEAGT